jgi:glycosyltransferase involved in cell wall biosynthesis
MIQVSVVIPLYNKAPHIVRTLQSVLRQTVEDYEVIVIDDGSTDGSGVVVQKIKDPRIRLIRQENQGEGATRNRGVQEARYEFIAFLDADDEWKPEFLKTILELRAKFPYAGAFATAYNKITSEGGLLRPDFPILKPGIEEGIIENYFEVALFYPVCSSAVAIPKSVLERVGGFPQGVVMGEDVETWLRIALHYPIAWTGRRLATIYLNATNRSWERFIGWNCEPCISQTAREALRLGLVPKDMIRDLKEYIAYFQIAAARDCLKLKQKRTALQLLEQARGTRKFFWEWWQWRLLAAIPGNPAPCLGRMKRVIASWLINNKYLHPKQA